MRSTQKPEVPKRLTPTLETIRELYLKSGNECAFPGCSERLINQEGVFIGEICHIEAAMPGGERFRRNQTNEERRSFANLILFCRKHHIITNDVVAYPVERLQKMKADHEAKYTDILQRIRSSLIDYTARRTTMPPATLVRLHDTLGWQLTSDQLVLTAESIAEFTKRFRRVPRRALEFLVILVDRGHVPNYNLFNQQVRALYHDIVEAMETDDSNVWKYMQILENYKLAYMEDVDGVLEIVVNGPDWPFWETLKEFCAKTGTPLSELIVEGRFDLLD